MITKTKRTSRAAAAGKLDGETRAWINPFGFDPTAGFNRRPELTEAERAEYAAAYDQAFRSTVRLR